MPMYTQGHIEPKCSCVLTYCPGPAPGPSPMPSRPILALCFHVYLFAKLVLTLVIQPDIRRWHFRRPPFERLLLLLPLHVVIIITCPPSQLTVCNHTPHPRPHPPSTWLTMASSSSWIARADGTRKNGLHYKYNLYSIF